MSPVAIARRPLTSGTVARNAPPAAVTKPVDGSGNRRERFDLVVGYESRRATAALKAVASLPRYGHAATRLGG